MQLCCSPRRLQLFTIFVVCVAIVTVLMILFVSNYPTFVRRKIADQVVFRNGTMEIDRFKTTADLKTLRLVFSLYNVTNADEVVKSSAKINIQEIGPFVYHEYKSKEFIDNNQTSGLITYKLRKQYIFKRELSIGDPQKMNITWPNVPLLAAGPIVDNLSYVKRLAARTAFNIAIKTAAEGPFMTDTVENFLFDGSKRYVFELLQATVGKYITPWPLKDNKFGILYDKNNTWYPEKDHVFTMSAGFGINQTVANLNQYIYINGSSQLGYWNPKNSSCNKLEGTDGEFFAPFVNASQELTIYSSDICRKLSFKYRTTSRIDGISVYKYSLEENNLKAGKNNPENLCYCLGSDGQQKYECGIDGLIDLSACVAPNVFGSGAHFLYGNETLSRRISGLKPANWSRDEPYMFVEPNVGIATEVRVPLQFNVKLEKDAFSIFNFFKEDEPLYIPLLTVTETGEMTEDQASLLRSKLLMLDSWLVCMVLGGSIVFITAIIAATIVIYMRFRHSQHITVTQSPVPSETDPLLPTSDPAMEASQDGNQPATNYQTVG